MGHARPSSRRTALAVLGVLLGLLATSGCGQLRDQLDGAVDESYADQVPTGDRLLETVEWGQVDGLLSVLVRNDADRVLHRAEAVVTVRGTAGETTVDGECCTAVEVPPGGTYGFSLYVGDSVVDEVEVTYRDVRWSGTGSTGGGAVTATPVALWHNAYGSVVTADVATHGGPVGEAVVQAVVDGPDGELAAVVSGTWTCFVPGVPRRIWMQLYTPLPEGSTVRSVTAFPRPDGRVGGDANPAATCDPESDVAGGADAP